MSTITIPVNDRTDMSFEGRKIASTDTYQVGKPRWTELALYTRDDGGYVFQRIGHSAMYHTPECRKVFGRLDMEPVPVSKIDDEEDYPCEECSPEDRKSGQVVFERNKYSAVAVDTVKQLLNAMHDRHRVTHEVRISKLAQELLLVAAEQDVAIRDATREVMLSGN